MNQLNEPGRTDSVLGDYVILAHQLLDTLDEEKTALSGRDFDELVRCAAAKTEICQKLETLGKEAQVGDCTQLKQLLAEIKERNLRNGALLNQSAIHNQQAMAILFGNHKLPSATYGSDGAIPTDATTGSLGRA